MKSLSNFFEMKTLKFQYIKLQHAQHTKNWTIYYFLQKKIYKIKKRKVDQDQEGVSSHPRWEVYFQAPFIWVFPIYRD